MSTVFS